MGSEVIVLNQIFAGKNFLIVGGGVTGNAVYRALHNLGAIATIVDERDGSVGPVGAISPAQVMEMGLELGLEMPWDCAVISPGWRPKHPLILALIAQKIELISEVDLAWKIRAAICPSQKWLAVTGTNGKTTTVEMATAMLLAANLNVAACGNLGNAVIEAVIDEANFDYLVVELSSFQLHWSTLPEFISAALLNIAEDHLDWHGTFEEYKNAKIKILERSDLAILNGDDPMVLLATQSWEGKKIFFTLGSPRAGEMGVVEDLVIDRAFARDPESADVICELAEIEPFAAHSVLNTLAAAGLAMAAGISPEVIRQAIRGFRPSRHRIEMVLDRNGIKWVNDSKATNPHAALASIRTFNSIIWLAGGLSKGANMDDLVVRGKGHIKSAILFGRDRDLIAQALKISAPQITVTLVENEPNAQFSVMERAVMAAKMQGQTGDVILLAPACASMDQFVDYADRGNQFSEAVLKFVGDK